MKTRKRMPNHTPAPMLANLSQKTEWETNFNATAAHTGQSLSEPSDDFNLRGAL